MFYAGQSREALRESWREAWERHRQNLPLEPLQAQIADVIGLHPEYHAFISAPASLQRDFTPEGGRENPFLHMSLHLALREQIGTDRPPGIQAEYRRLCTHSGDAHEVQHRMIEVLATALWEAQRAGRPPDEQAYLEALRRL